MVRASFLVILAKVMIKITLRATGLKDIWDVLEDMPEFSKELWAELTREEVSVEARRSTVEAAANANKDDIESALRDPAIQTLLTKVPAAAKPRIIEELRDYLRLIPGAIRRTYRRWEDPTGKTVPPELVPRQARDLIPLLAVQKPRFSKGDRPIAGADWRLEEFLGIGGFGEVWKAGNPHLSSAKPSVLKFATDPLARSMLERGDARLNDLIQRAGSHPGIVPLLETYLSSDPPCLRFEYVEGGDLAGLMLQWSRKKPGPPPLALAKVMLAICRPVAFAHGLKPAVVHRDLKPANILVSQKNGKIQFKIADFGIGGIASAQAIRDLHQGSKSALRLSRTSSGSYTPLYASLEQRNGGLVDPRDDVHALGVIWYQLMMGDLSEERPGGSEWMKVFERRGMPTPMIELINSCFEKAEWRPRDAQTLVERLEVFCSTDGGQGIAVQPEKPIEGTGEGQIQPEGIPSHAAARGKGFEGAGEPERVTKYAGLWGRLLATCVDFFVIVISLFCLLFSFAKYITPLFGKLDERTLALEGEIVLIVLLSIPFIYYIFMECSRWQGTVGTRLLRMRITNLKGQRIGVIRSVARQLCKLLMLLTFGLGFLMAGATRRKQGLHDILAGTLVESDNRATVSQSI